MNVPLPAGLFNNNAYFYANNTFNLGSMSKPVNAVTLVSIDYSQLPGPPANFTSWWFQVDVGTQPPLTVTNPILTGNVLTFLLSKGVPGVTYNLDVNVTYGVGPITRTDSIIVEIPFDDCGCGSGGSPSFPAPGGPVIIPSAGNLAGFLTGEGVVFLNSGVRFFVSAVAPASASILDWWYNSISGTLSMLTTDGSNLIWVPFNTATIGSSIHSEQLNVTALNIVSNLTFATNNEFIQLVVNGQTFSNVGPDKAFTVFGNVITWVSTLYSIPPGATVVATYTY